jgi:hypothetical protein
MRPRRASWSAIDRVATAVCTLLLSPIIAPDHPALALSWATRQDVATSHVLRVQATSANLAGRWVSKTGEQFEIFQAAGDTVDMTFSGPTPTSRKGKISGNYDGAVFAGAYEATEGSTTDRGVVRFLRKPDGTLEGSWRSLVTGRQGTWSLTKK